MSGLVTGQILLATLMLGLPAHAGEPETPVQLSLRGIDLSDPAARAEVERRIDRAAARVCGLADATDAADRQRRSACVIATGNDGRAALARVAAAREARASRMAAATVEAIGQSSY